MTYGIILIFYNLKFGKTQSYSNFNNKNVEENKRTLRQCFPLRIIQNLKDSSGLSCRSLNGCPLRKYDRESVPDDINFVHVNNRKYRLPKN